MFRIAILSLFAALACAVPCFAQGVQPGYQWVRGPGGYQLVPQSYYYVPQQNAVPPVVEYHQLPVGSYPTGQEQIYAAGKYVLFTTPYNQRHWVWFPAQPIVPTTPYPYQVPYQPYSPYQPTFPQVPGNVRPPFGGPGGVLPEPGPVGQKPIGTPETAPTEKPESGPTKPNLRR